MCLKIRLHFAQALMCNLSQNSVVFIQEKGRENILRSSVQCLSIDTDVSIYFDNDEIADNLHTTF